MPDSSLVPEQPLTFSPGLAATIGLEEAVLLQYLQGLFPHRPARLRDGFHWLTVERSFLLQHLPFWSPADLHRILRALVDKGVLLVDSPPLHSAETLIFALNEAADSAPAANHSSPVPVRGAGRSASQLPVNWAPGEDLLQLLALNHNIHRQFALDQLEDFIFYWRERGDISHAWENKFRQHVLGAWRRHQQQLGESQRPPEPPALEHWRPSEDAMEIMVRSGVDRGFIEEAIPEFVLYWRERGDAPRELNTKFIQHIRLQWARYTASVRHSTEPTRIPQQWQPDRDVFDILGMSHIDEDFARSLLPEFIVYWRDSNQAHTSWNSKFLQHVKYHWARQHQLQQPGHSHEPGHSREPGNTHAPGKRHDGPQPGSNPTGRTRDRSLADDLSDTSWAN